MISRGIFYDRNKKKRIVEAALCLVFFMGAINCMKTQLNHDQDSLLEDIEEFNESVGEKGWNLNNKIIKNKSVSGIRLINSVWEDMDLRDSKFIASHIDGSTFRRTNFSDIDFANSVFINCLFNDCEFIGSKFSEAKFSHCQINRCKFENIDLNKSLSQYSDWNDVKAIRLDWKYARLENASFIRGEYEDVMFSDSILSHISFSNSKMINSGFIGAAFEQCQCQIEGRVVNFTDAKCNRLRIIGAPTVNDLNLAGMKGNGLWIENLNNSKFFALDFAEIEDFRLDNSQLRFSSCVSAFLSNSIFQNTRFDCIRFDKTRFQNVNFKNITFIDEIIFDDAFFENTQFMNIRKADNYSGTFRNTIFEGKTPF